MQEEIFYLRRPSRQPIGEDRLQPGGAGDDLSRLKGGYFQAVEGGYAGSLAGIHDHGPAGRLPVHRHPQGIAHQAHRDKGAAVPDPGGHIAQAVNPFPLLLIRHQAAVDAEQDLPAALFDMYRPVYLVPVDIGPQFFGNKTHRNQGPPPFQEGRRLCLDPAAVYHQLQLPGLCSPGKEALEKKENQQKDNQGLASVLEHQLHMRSSF